MAKTLDRTRDFGIIQGDDQGRMFEQDGTFFAGDGAEWTEPKRRGGKASQATVEQPVPVDDGATAAVLDQVDAQLQG